MNSGTLKQLLTDNAVISLFVQFHPEDGDVTYTVQSAKFDQITRNTIFLDVTTTPKPRTNNTQIIKSYLLDFKDTHTVLIRDNQKATNSLQLSSDYIFDNESGALTILVEKRIKTNTQRLPRDERPTTSLV